MGFEENKHLFYSRTSPPWARSGIMYFGCLPIGLRRNSRNRGGRFRNIVVEVIHQVSSSIQCRRKHQRMASPQLHFSRELNFCWGNTTALRDRMDTSWCIRVGFACSTRGVLFSRFGVPATLESCQRGNARSADLVAFSWFSSVFAPSVHYARNDLGFMALHYKFIFPTGHRNFVLRLSLWLTVSQFAS